MPRAKAKQDVLRHTGDDGCASLPDGTRWRKCDPRFDVLGTLDELNALLGLALALGLPKRVRGDVMRMQRMTLQLGMCLPFGARAAARPALRELETMLAELDRMLARACAGLPPLHSFILPGGTPAAAALHVARTVSRRVERLVTALKMPGRAAPLIRAVCNRLSMVLFALARACNRAARVKDTPL